MCYHQILSAGYDQSCMEDLLRYEYAPYKKKFFGIGRVQAPIVPTPENVNNSVAYSHVYVPYNRTILICHAAGGIRDAFNDPCDLKKNRLNSSLA